MPFEKGQAVEKVYGLAEAEKYIGLGLEQIRNLIKSGDIKAIRPGGGKYYILESELERIQRSLVKPAGTRQ